MTFSFLSGVGRAARRGANEPATVGSVLIQRVPWISADQTVREVLGGLRYGALDPRTLQNLFVLDGAGIVRGAVSLRTLLSSDPETCVAGLMSSRMLTVERDTELAGVARLMEQNQVSVLPAVDADGRPLGAVVLEDVRRSLLRSGIRVGDGSAGGPERRERRPAGLEGARAGAARSLVNAVAGLSSGRKVS